jgi:hypothetical protein
MMLGLDTLDVAIGLVMLFMGASLLCTSVREFVESLMRTRAADLEAGVRELLADPTGTLTKELYSHPLISSLYKGTYAAPDPRKLFNRGGELPSYIPSGQFATAMLDIVASKAPAARRGAMTVASLRQSVDKLPEGNAREAIRVALDHADGDLAKARAEVEAWFNGTMDRVSGWYRRRTQMILFVIGIGVAVTLNIDAVAVAERLAADKALRAAAVGLAQATPDPSGSASASFDTARQNLESIGFPIGWAGGWPVPQVTVKCPPPSQARGCDRSPVARIGLHSDPASDGRQFDLGLGGIVKLLIGWLATALAVTLGAPFWFDVLNKFMVIRSTVKPREKSREEGSEDRPAPAKK